MKLSRTEEEEEDLAASQDMIRVDHVVWQKRILAQLPTTVRDKLNWLYLKTDGEIVFNFWLTSFTRTRLIRLPEGTLDEVVVARICLEAP